MSPSLAELYAVNRSSAVTVVTTSSLPTAVEDFWIDTELVFWVDAGGVMEIAMICWKEERRMITAKKIAVLEERPD